MAGPADPDLDPGRRPARRSRPRALHLLRRPGRTAGGERPRSRAGRLGGIARVLEASCPGPGDLITMKTAEESCERLLSCAEGHGEAEGSAMWIGDLEDFLRAALA